MKPIPSCDAEPTVLLTRFAKLVTDMCAKVCGKLAAARELRYIYIRVLGCIDAGGANVQQESAQTSAPPPQRPALSTRLLFDKDTAVSLPTPEEQATAVEKKEKRAGAAGERAGKAASSIGRTQEHTFLQPQALADLPAELRPHFKLAVRCAALYATDIPIFTDRWCQPRMLLDSSDRSPEFWAQQ